ncbi:MAG: metallophosphoesterase family protein [Oscillospiraceae bacterium]|nr:metallophosphoesterase family protein [Oscillospiraceae bacterium]
MSQKKIPLRFHKDGTFRIMQIADIQESPVVCGDTLKFLNAALEKEKPDLVVLTGDQLKGYSVYFHMPGGTERVSTTLEKIMEPIASHHVPFLVTFGNHDITAGLSKQQQMYYYLQYPECINTVKDAEDCATCCTTISGQDGKPAFAVYMLDTNADRFAPLLPQQIDWYRETRTRLKEANGGRYLPSLVFQHIPVPEFYEFLQEVPKGTADCIEAFGSRRGHFYALDQTKVYGGSLGEAPCVPERNSGELAALTEAGDVVGLYVGHDHRNSFWGPLHGIDAGYAPCCGFNTYGPGFDRAVRMFTLHEKEPRRYETQLVSYSDLFGFSVSNPMRNLFLDKTPATPEQVLSILLKTAAVTGTAACLLHQREHRHSR